MTRALLTGLALLIAPAVWFASVNGVITNPLKLALFLGLVTWVALYTVFYTVFPARRDSAWTTQLELINFWILSWLIVSVTGWFSSPFLFMAYVLLIAAYFVLSPLATLGMAVSVGLMYFLKMHQISTIQDYLVLASLALTAVVAFYLRRQYLKIGEADNGVLVLKTEKPFDDGTLSEVLTNRITQFSALVREPLVNIKNYTHVIGKHDLDPETRWDYMQKIYDSATTAIKELTKFEEETTGHRMRSSGSDEIKAVP